MSEKQVMRESTQISMFESPPEPTNNPDDPNPILQHTQSSVLSTSKQGGRWTKEEHDLFVEGLALFGRDWRQIETHIGGTRTCSQIRSHAQKYFIRKEKLGT